MARSFALDTKLLRKLTILFREQVERRLYESGRAFGISIGSEGIHIGAAYDDYQAFPSSTSPLEISRRKPSSISLLDYFPKISTLRSLLLIFTASRDKTFQSHA